MNNERYNQIIDEVYKNYANSHWTPPENPNSKLLAPQLWSVIPMQHNKEFFIHEIKTNPKFSKKWGLKIEERELSEGERLWICSQKHHIRFGTNDGPPWYSPDNPDRDKLKWMTESQRGLCDYKNIPTKLITITYKDEKIEVYE